MPIGALFYCKEGGQLNTVSPITDIEIVKTMGRYLRERNERDYIMFLLGIYSGLRISDILKLRVLDVQGKSSITLREKKTGKQRNFPINPFLKKELTRYIKKYELKKYDHLITSRQGGSKKPITRVRAYQILREVGDCFEMDNIGTHSMRKTFGYWYYKQTKDAVTLQKILNHRSIRETLIYIGIDQENIDSTVNSLKIY